MVNAGIISLEGVEMNESMQERKASNCWLIGHIISQKCILSYLTIQPIFNPIWWVPHSILAVYTFVNLAFYR